MIEYFDYTLGDDLSNADQIHFNGLFNGNHHFSLEMPFKKLDKLIKKKFGN